MTRTEWNPPTLPTRNCFQIGEDRVWACEYPGNKDNSAAIRKLRVALEFGITHFIDLTEEGELNPYAHFLPSLVHYQRFPIRDVYIPTSMADTLKLMQDIQGILADPLNRVYLHCWGGVGRTGTIAACWIAYSCHTDYEETMQRLVGYWQQCPKSQYRDIPDHICQLGFIRDFIEYLNEKL